VEIVNFQYTAEVELPPATVVSQNRPRAKRPITDRRLRRWQEITAASLIVGYAGSYLGRSCLEAAPEVARMTGSKLLHIPYQTFELCR